MPEGDESETLTNESATQHKVAVIDGMAMVNQVNFKGLQTCKDFADRFIQKLHSSTLGYQEVRLVFDRYIAKSLKSRTRDKRTAGIQVR